MIYRPPGATYLYRAIGKWSKCQVGTAFSYTIQPASRWLIEPLVHYQGWL
jgi:hypothetical protein